MAGTVTGAAVLGGELILSLSDGQIINCGLIQGAPGPKGAPGPVGATGQPGRDGNGILHGNGAPRADEGEVNDFFIDTAKLHLYGPKTASGWGNPAYLRPDDQGRKASTGQRYDEATLNRNRIFGPGTLLVGGGPAPVMGSGQTAGLDKIIGFGQPFPANTMSKIAGDPTKGDVMHVLVYGQGAAGSWYGEVVATKDDISGATAHVVAWETPLNTPPNLTFATSLNAGELELSMSSDVPLTLLRGKAIYV